jgi:mono/diheme cytochrome c family protein
MGALERRTGVLLSFTLAALALAGCEEPVPATPTFAHDVLPIFRAACVRCHGAGGTLNMDPTMTGPFKGETAPNGYFDSYANVGDCTPDPATQQVPASCGRGALADAGLLAVYLHPSVASQRMPPPPSEPLARWELEVVDNWLAEKPVPLP